jgi:hypothetical protein
MTSRRNAEIAGNKLLKRMKGKGWKLKVWENLGWHYAVYLPIGDAWRLTVHPSLYRDEEAYFTLLGRGGGGEPCWTPEGSHPDPNQAVRDQMDLIRDFIYERAEMFTDLEEALDG